MIKLTMILEKTLYLDNLPNTLTQQQKLKSCTISQLNLESFKVLYLRLCVLDISLQKKIVLCHLLLSLSFQGLSSLF